LVRVDLGTERELELREAADVLEEVEAGLLGRKEGREGREEKREGKWEGEREREGGSVRALGQVTTTASCRCERGSDNGGKKEKEDEGERNAPPCPPSRARPSPSRAARPTRARAPRASSSGPCCARERCEAVRQRVLDGSV